MKRALLLIVLVTNFSYAETSDHLRIRELENSIQDNYGIIIYQASSHISAPSEIQYFHFLNAFITYAERRELRKRFMPVSIEIKVEKENWGPIDLHTFGPDLTYGDYHGNVVEVGHRSARALVNFLKNKFPKENTESAWKLRKRNQAVRRAIMDKIAWARQQGVLVRSCPFSRNVCDLYREDDIGYFTQEKLLQGLMRLEDDIKNHLERRISVNITTIVNNNDDLVYSGQYEIDNMFEW